jgi:hypothetical protein
MTGGQRPNEDYPPHAMVADDSTLFYPDDEADARFFREEHGAVPVWPDLFPFPAALVLEPVVRARVTLTVEVLSRNPLEVTGEHLWAAVADRFGRVCDSSPHIIRVSLPGLPYEQYEQYEEYELGTIDEGPVQWLDGTAPEQGFHCGKCRTPLDPDAGPCLRMVPWGSGERPCQSDDAQHHGRCWHRQPLGPVRLTDGVA